MIMRLGSTPIILTIVLVLHTVFGVFSVAVTVSTLLKNKQVNIFSRKFGLIKSC